ncbi:hypothetical protein SAMN04489761_3172 [Tenacibaculum sp. MAR_2009_124]|uniref:DUF6427 family protein n=1 Tax=Tenacibaculum sp. MAR_2009_124 TaxID=1250059 RepID=UPI00089682A8|nr:DUF6427 family protein [Tenacibaculum sp. MAR_2009_124]SEC50372.1 hypothetical protein SAMN04489761_3172 [Tenacibaculum sp. MAR_2009_124]
MLANFFSKSKPVNFVVLFLLFLIYFGIALFLKNISFFSAGKEVFLFIIVFSIYNFIVLKNEVTFDNSFAFLFYVILIGFFIKHIEINSIFYANLICLLLFRKAYSVQTSKKVYQKLFDAGLWLGISFILEPYTFIFIFLLYIAVYLHNQLTYRTLLIPVLGYFVPVFFYYTYCFWYDKTEQFSNLFSWRIVFDYHLYSSKNFLFSILFIGVFTFLSIILKSPRTLAVLNKFRKNWILILLHLILSGVVFLQVPERTGVEFMYLLFPTSVVLANGVELIKKRWLADVFILLFLISSFVLVFT